MADLAFAVQSTWSIYRASISDLSLHQSYEAQDFVYGE
jgi:hypothetical protein